MSDTTLVLPEGAVPLEAVEPDLGSVQSQAFDSRAYRLNLPEVDGIDAEAIEIGFSGSVKLDLANEADLAMFNSLTLGKEVDLRVSGVVADRLSPLKEKKDGVQTMTRKAKVSVHTVYVLTPEEF